MGDRANVCVVEREGGEIYLYTHWYGYALPKILAEALDRGRDRWNDESYLTRIIFSCMVDEHLTATTGFGISTYRTDGNHTDLTVDIKHQVVQDREGKILSFEDFISHYKNSSNEE